MKEGEFVICSIISRLERIQGRKKLQKMVYVAKALGYPIKENFVWGNYGVFSSELQMELQSLIREKAISEGVRSVGGVNEYEYSLGECGERLLKQATSLTAMKEEVPEPHVQQYEDPVTEIGNNELESMLGLLAFLNTKSSSDLELWSSILYLRRTEKNDDNLVSFLSYLKSQYSEREIRNGMKDTDELRPYSLEAAKCKV